MPDKPAAEIRIDAELVRELLQEQAPQLAGAADEVLRHVADGWDCAVWRLGDDLAVRLPRRAVAAPLILHEQQVLPGIARRLAPAGLGVPVPLVTGRPARRYPWAWSIVPWFAGDTGLVVPRVRRIGWAAPLARAVRLLHTPAAPGFPPNPVRGVALRTRAAAVHARVDALKGQVAADALARLALIWDAALRAPAWSDGPVWIHGDLHPGNLVARGGRLVAMIDFGDVTAGDPAYDLSVAWMAFDREGRTAFRAELSDRYDEATWTRAKGWAAAVALMLLGQSDDDPPYAELGAEAVAELVAAED